jgi:enamine deaminase RidA (YjgF/YER057c/UK114 family)
MTRSVTTPAAHWSWPEGPEPQALRVGNTIYVGGQLSLAPDGKLRDAGDIEGQTANVFTDLVTMLEAAGASMKDLVKLHTYYVFEGEGRDVTAYWERMTAVRLRYLADPGPAATAVRVSGAPRSQVLIAVDGVASLDTPKRRIMPTHTWDWSIPTPFSQGWRIGDKVYVGGQISADMQGKALAVGDVAQQTRNILELIRHVLVDGGAGWNDLVTLRICYKHGADGAGAALYEQIRRVVIETLPEPRPTLTAFGADLLYEGLLLEIDALAVPGRKRAPVAATPTDSGFPLAGQVGDEVYFSVPGEPAADIDRELEGVLATIDRLLASARATPSQLVKLTAFYVTEGADEAASRALRLGLRRKFPAPVLTMVRVAALPGKGQRLQIDGVCVQTAASAT